MLELVHVEGHPNSTSSTLGFQHVVYEAGRNGMGFRVQNMGGSACDNQNMNI